MAQIAKIAIEAATYAIDKPYDYLVPDGMELCPGMRVNVPFGRGNRRSEGMILAVNAGWFYGWESSDGAAGSTAAGWKCVFWCIYSVCTF